MEDSSENETVKDTTVEAAKWTGVALGTYLIVKWAIAAAAAPETSGVSLVFAAATP